MTKTVSGPEYEQRLRDAAAAGESAPDIEPPEEYEMSAEFQAWLVDQMRGHVMDQVSQSGLDRMAVLKASEGADEEASDEADD